MVFESKFGMLVRKCEEVLEVAEYCEGMGGMDEKKRKWKTAATYSRP